MFHIVTAYFSFDQCIMSIRTQNFGVFRSGPSVFIFSSFHPLIDTMILLYREFGLISANQLVGKLSCYSIETTRFYLWADSIVSTIVALLSKS